MNANPFGGGMLVVMAGWIPEWRRHQSAQDVIGHGLHQHPRRYPT
jgi:hypothetical protein